MVARAKVDPPSAARALDLEVEGRCPWNGHGLPGARDRRPNPRVHLEFRSVRPPPDTSPWPSRRGPREGRAARFGPGPWPPGSPTDGRSTYPRARPRRRPGTPPDRWSRARAHASRRGSNQRSRSALSASAAASAATVRCTVPRPPSGEWTICRSSMFTPASLIAAVTSASTPGRSGTGTCITATPAFTWGLAASESRASFACSNARSTSAASRESISVLSRVRRSTYRSIARTIASPLASRMSLHRCGLEAASRVRSRNPPAASSSISGSPASSAAARPISDVEATCGRWLTMATSRSWRSASIGTGRAPTFSTQPDRRATDASGTFGSGVSTQTTPSSAEADAWPGPERSEPPIGCPPTYRGRLLGSASAATRAITGDLTLPTSLTIASGDRRRISATSPGTSGIGVHTNTRVAPATHSSRVAAGTSPERSAAAPSTPGSMSNPRTASPARIAAIAIDVPISPVPTTATRSAEVIAEALGAVEVDVADPLGRERGVELQQHPDHPRHRAFDGDLLRAQQGYATQAHAPSGLGREGGTQVVGDREERAHDVVGLHRIAFEHRGETA